VAEGEPQQYRSVIDRLLAHAAAAPERIAFTFVREDGRDESVTSGELVARIDLLAGVLAREAAPGERALLLYQPGLAGALASGRTRLLCSDGGGSEPALLPTVDPHALAFIQYTSGSTRTPRGVEVSHANLAANVAAIEAAFGFDAASVMVSWLPPSHDMGLVGSIVAPAAVGFRSVLMAPATFLRQPQRWLAAISAYRATCAGAPDFAWDLCVRRSSAADKAGLDLSCLQVAYNGAERGTRRYRAPAVCRVWRLRSAARRDPPMLRLGRAHAAGHRRSARRAAAHDRREPVAARSGPGARCDARRSRCA